MLNVTVPWLLHNSSKTSATSHGNFGRRVRRRPIVRSPIVPSVSPSPTGQKTKQRRRRMSSMLLEVTRALHKKIEQLELLIVKDLQTEPATNKDRFHQSHRVRNVIEKILESSTSSPSYDWLLCTGRQGPMGLGPPLRGNSSGIGARDAAALATGMAADCGVDRNGCRARILARPLAIMRRDRCRACVHTARAGQSLLVGWFRDCVRLEPWEGPRCVLDTLVRTASDVDTYGASGFYKTSNDYGAGDGGRNDCSPSCRGSSPGRLSSLAGHGAWPEGMHLGG
nr:splicing factor SF3a60 homolog [Ipomoea batatas]